MEDKVKIRVHEVAAHIARVIREEGIDLDTVQIFPTDPEIIRETFHRHHIGTVAKSIGWEL